MKGKTSMRRALLNFIVPLIVALIVAVFFFGSRMTAETRSDKEMYYNKLYTINTTLLNADRDFYQSMLAAVQEKSAGGGLDADTRGTLISDYEEKKQQTIDNVDKAAAIAKTDADLWTGIKSTNGETFAELTDKFESGVAEWASSYNVNGNSGDWTQFSILFYSTREYMNSMQEITETWAEAEMDTQQANTFRVIIISFIVFMVVAVALFILAMLVANKMVNSLQGIAKELRGISQGDFASEVAVTSTIKEFYQIEHYMEEMRSKVQSVLKDVVTGSVTVSEGAENARDGVSGSQKTASDISSAVNDLAQGATSMAEDVQTTTGITVEIGSAVDQVMDAASENLERGRTVYDESTKVQQQLLEIQKQDAETDAMAGEVADSVNETAEVVRQISTAAESIISIASQTNLLALNASIEAARAGEAGKGFAVVADNIKSLAEETNQMAGEITQMLSSISNFSENNKKLTGKIKEATTNEAAALEEMVDSFEQMLALLKETEDGNKTIMELVDNLNHSKDTIMNSMESLSSISQENAASTEETSASLMQLESTMQTIVDEADHLSEVAEQLQQNVKFFRVDENAPKPIE